MINIRLLRETRIKKNYISLNVIHSLLNSLFTILNAYFLAIIVDSIFIRKQSPQSIEKYVLLLIINAALKALCNSAFDIYLKKSSEEIKEKIKTRTFDLIISANPLKVKEYKSGELMNLLTDGAEALTPYYSQYIPQFFSSILIPLVIGITIAFKDGLSAFIMFLTYPLIPVFMALIGYRSKEKNEQQWKRLTALSSHFLDMLQGLRTLKAFGRSKHQEKKVYDISENYRKSTIEVLKVSFLSALVLETSATISTAVVAVNLGLRLVYSKVGFFTAFFILVLTPEFYAPLRQLGIKFHTSLNGQVAMEKIEAVKRDLVNSELTSEESYLQVDNLEIRVENLHFSHDGGELLNKVSFRIKPHEKVALIGESGSGKSTLVNILSGALNPPDNTVFINGRDINQINKDAFVEKVAVIPQFPHIFNMSIKDNIMLGNSIAAEELMQICKLTYVDEFIEKFKDKYNTIVGEGEDIALSGGEKQRIALARALAKGSEIIILDEPTSALDPETEDLLQAMIYKLLENKTVFISAHRLNTIKAADRILVLNNGFIVEEGSHEELLLLKGKYYEMIKTMEEVVL